MTDKIIGVIVVIVICFGILILMGIGLYCVAVSAGRADVELGYKEPYDEIPLNESIKIIKNKITKRVS